MKYSSGRAYAKQHVGSFDVNRSINKRNNLVTKYYRDGKLTAITEHFHNDNYNLRSLRIVK